MIALDVVDAGGFGMTPSRPSFLSEVVQVETSNVQIGKDRAALQFAGTLTGRKYAAVMTDRGGIVRVCGEWWSVLQATQHRGQAERLYRRYANEWHPCEWDKPKPG